MGDRERGKKRRGGREGRESKHRTFLKSSPRVISWVCESSRKASMVLRATLGNTTVPRTVYTVWRTRALRRCLVCVKGRSLATRTAKSKKEGREAKDETGRREKKGGGDVKGRKDKCKQLMKGPRSKLMIRRMREGR